MTIPQAPVRSPAWTWQRCFGGIYLLGLCALLARLAIGTVREPGIAKLTICRPERRNAFRPQTLFELTDAFTLVIS